MASRSRSIVIGANSKLTVETTIVEEYPLADTVDSLLGGADTPTKVTNTVRVLTITK